MAEIKNYTLNFGSGRPARLTFAVQKLACTEVALREQCVQTCTLGKVV